MNFRKLAIGTAQFGLEYGIANRVGQVSRAEAEAILRVAKSNGVDTLDTAILYGKSESLLGEIGISDWNVVSKLPEMPLEERDPSRWVQGQVLSSLERLNVRCLAGLLLHRPEQLTGARGKRLYDALKQQKEDGLIERIGISIYDPSELDRLPPQMDFDIVQAPFNIFDNRLIESGWLGRLKEANCQVYVRSIFLQGLLLFAPEERPSQFARWRPVWQSWHSWLSQTGLTPLEACMRYVLSFDDVYRVIIGVETASQLEQAIVASTGILPPVPERFHTLDETLLNPALWNRV